MRMRTGYSLKCRKAGVLAVLLWLCAGMLPLQAQWLGYAQQPRPAGTGPWNRLASEHFDLLYSASQRHIAENCLQLAEMALYELRTQLEYESDELMRLTLYANATQLSTWNEAPSYDGERRMYAPFGGIYPSEGLAGTYAVIKTEVARLLLADMLYGSGARNRFTSRLLTYEPEWLEYGLSAYLGEGWTADDEAVLRSLPDDIEPALLILENASDLRIKVLRKSIWRFVELAFGDKRLAEVLYICRMNRSIQRGLSAGTNLSIGAFTLRWSEFVRKSAAPEGRANLLGPSDTSTAWLLPLSTGKRPAELLVAALSPKGGRVAYVLRNKEGFELKFWEVKEKKNFSSGLRTRSPELWRRPSLPAPALAWSPDGSTVAVALPEADGQCLFYYNLGTDKTERKPLSGALQWLNSLAWSPDGKQLLASGLSGVQSDLWLAPAGTSSFTRLTDDLADDLDPSWGGDGRIYFASNRDTSLNTTSRTQRLDDVFHTYDIYSLDPKNPKLARQQSQTGSVTERQPQWLNGKLLARSNELGLWNTIRLSNDSLTRGLLSNWHTGALGMQTHSSERWLATATQNGRLCATMVPAPTLGASLTPERSLLGYDLLKQYRQRKQQELMRAGKWMPPPSPEPVAPPQPEQPETPDSTEQEGPDEVPDNRPRYYVFDEPDAPRPPKTNPKRKGRQTPPMEHLFDIPAFDVEKIAILPPQPLRPMAVIRSYEGGFVVNPIYGPGLWGHIQVEDPLRRHLWRFGATGWLSTSNWVPGMEASVLYRYRHRRVQGEFYGRYQNLSTPFPAAYNYQHVEARFGAFYPIDRFMRIGVRTGVLFVQRNDQSLLDNTRLDASATLVPLELQYELDRTRRRDFFIYSGLRAKANLQTNYHTGDNKPVYSSLRVDLAGYVPVYRGMTLALRMQTGIGLGDDSPQYFLGGINNWVFNQFDNTRDLPVTKRPEAMYFSEIVTPMRGFNYNARNAKYFGLLTAELRIPLIRMLTRKLAQGPLINSQFVLFYDVGTAWTTGNPFSQKNPIDGATIVRPPLTVLVQSFKSPFIQGFGLGFRTKFLGHVLKMEYAIGIEDGSLVNQQFSVSIGQEF